VQCIRHADRQTDRQTVVGAFVRICSSASDAALYGAGHGPMQGTDRW